MNIDRKYIWFLTAGILIGLLLACTLVAHASSTYLFPVGGGLGTSTPPTYGQIPVGNANGTYSLTATSSLGITGGSSSSSFPFTPSSYGVSTSTTIGLLNGYLSTASSTQNGSLFLTGLNNGLLGVDGSGKIFQVASSTFDTFAYPFPNILGGGNATSSLTGFSGGILSTASTTIGANTQATGLTISGGSTTTLNALFQGNVGFTGGGNITGASGALTFASAGTNQGMNFTTTGTGQLVFNSSPTNFNVGTAFNNTSAVQTPNVASFLAPNATTGGVGTGAYALIGVANSAQNSGAIQFTYAGSGSNSNFMTFGINGTASILDVFKSGVGIGTGVSIPPTNGLTVSGNTGLGTTTPNWQLEVAGTRPSFALTDNSATSNLKHWLFSSMGGNLYVGTSTDLYATSSPSVLSLLNGGNVGIGTSTPGSLFSIGGVGNFTTATSTFYGTGGLSLSGGCYAINGNCLTAGSIGGGFTQAVNWAATTTLSGTPTYSNGTAGVGATLTEVGTGALYVDGNNPAIGDRVLIKNQGTAFQNGIYTVTATGSGIASYILTRATDYNTPTEITPGINTYIISGTANLDSTWAVSFTPPLSIGATSLTYSESAAGGTVTSVATNSTLTGGPITTSGTLGLNLGNSNIWTVLQQFTGNASSTQLSVPNQAWFGSTATSTFNSAGFLGIASTTPIFPLSVNSVGSDFYVKTTGEVVGIDQTNAWEGRISPTHTVFMPWATTTPWTGTTTSAYQSVDTVVMPFAGTLRNISCTASTTASFLGVTAYINHTNITPSYFVASSTSGTINVTANNTFNKGDTLGMYVGTTTSDTNALSGGCNFNVTENP